VPASAAAVAKISWDELQILAATLYANEITAVETGSGLELLVERLSRLSSERRRVLRAALADTPA
jgi:hypothetical protein